MHGLGPLAIGSHTVPFPLIQGGMGVRVSAGREGGDAVVEVSDDGVGMDPETARQCVDLFFTTKPEGTGLGLAIVQFIVTEHGGTLDIQTEKERGTTVLVRLPVTA